MTLFQLHAIALHYITEHIIDYTALHCNTVFPLHCIANHYFYCTLLITKHRIASHSSTRSLCPFAISGCILCRQDPETASPDSVSYTYIHPVPWSCYGFVHVPAKKCCHPRGASPQFLTQFLFACESQSTKHITIITATRHVLCRSCVGDTS